MRTDKKIELARKRHWRVRKRVVGTASRPRMSVVFSNQHIYVQFIDDEAGVTLASASTRRRKSDTAGRLAANRTGAQLVGGLAAEAAKAKGVTEVVFDRGGDRYHWTRAANKSKQVSYGKLATLAQAARAAGLRF